MVKVLIGFLIVIVFYTNGFCGDLSGKDLLMEECVRIFKNHSFDEPVIYGAKQKIQFYEGLAGDIDTFGCRYKAKMRLDFSDKKIVGEFYYTGNKYMKMPIKGMIDKNNNIILIEIIENRWEGYKFNGVINSSILKGCWSKGDGKKGFPFYAIEVIGE